MPGPRADVPDERLALSKEDLKTKPTPCARRDVADGLRDLRP